ncbi:hypothetical protein D3C72_2455010 [compost metagenome]
MYSPADLIPPLPYLGSSEKQKIKQQEKVETNNYHNTLFYIIHAYLSQPIHIPVHCNEGKR